MRNVITAFSILLAGLSASAAAQKTAYTLFNAKGKEARYEKMVNDCKRADVILFGELHNYPIAHWLQLELTKELHADSEVKLVMGAAMFEADGQLIMDEYFAGMITEKKFEEEMRLWNNYKTDYKKGACCPGRDGWNVWSGKMAQKGQQCYLHIGTCLARSLGKNCSCCKF
jgi:uncharacterized iron-regulated protein